MEAKKEGKSYIRAMLIGATIFTVLVAHFAVSQFIAFKSEADSAVVELTEKQTTAIESANVEKKSTENETAVAATSAVPATKTNVAPSLVRAERKIEPKQRTVEKETIGAQKAARENRAERLRRAERILTGI